MRKVGLVAALVLLTACGTVPATARQTPNTTPVAAASPSPATPSPSPAASRSPFVSPVAVTPGPSTPKPVAVTCSSQVASGAALALVTLRGSTDIVVRDLTDLSKPVTRCAFKACRQGCASFGPDRVRFVDGTHVSYTVNGDGGDALYLADLQTRKTTLVLWVRTAQGFVIDYAWAPDASALVYVTQPASGESGMQYHQLKGGSDRVLATLPPMPAVGCEGPCAGEDAWDFSLLYSLDGNFVSLTDSIVDPVFRVWTADGKQLNQTDTETRAWSVWSGDGLYFASSAGISVWRNGTINTFLPAKGWMRAKASPGAGQIVYGARDASGWVHVYVVETGTAKIFELKKARIQPAYLTSRYIWYGGQRACVAADRCVFATTASGKTYIYDLLNGTEAESIITSVSDTWPHAA